MTRRARALLLRLDPLVDSAPLRLLAFSCLAAWFCAEPLAAAGRIGEWFDHRFYYALGEVTRKTLVEQHTLPLWNPYFCGGIPHLGNPTVSIVVPTLPLLLLFGTAVGQKLTIVVMLVVGIEGCFRLARKLGADPLSALVAGPVFAVSGQMASWIHSGQDFFGVELIPWVLLMTIRAQGGDRPAILWGGLWMAWMIGTVPAYPVLWCPLIVGCWSLFAFACRLRERSVPAALATLALPAAMALLGAALQGARLLPMLTIFGESPRRVAALADATAPLQLWHALVHPEGAGRVGLGILATALVGLWATRWRWRLLAMFAFIVLLSLGDQTPLWDALCRLPLYRNLRYASRLVALVPLPLGLLASLGLTRVRESGERMAPGAGVLVAVACVAMLMLDLLPQNRAIMGNPYTVEEVPRIRQAFAQSRGNHWLNQLWPRIDRGSIACYEETPFRTSAAVRGDLPAEERLEAPAVGAVRRVRWRADAIDLVVDSERPARLLVNQNFDPGWRSSVGRVVSAQGALAVELPAGRHRVALRYRPRSFWLGLLVTALGAGAWLLGYSRLRKAGRS